MNKYDIAQALLKTDLNEKQLSDIASIIAEASGRVSTPSDNNALYAKYMDLLDSLDEDEQEEYLKLLMTFVK